MITERIYFTYMGWHLHSIQTLVPRSCGDPDLWRAEKLDPAGELNKRISWHSAEWLTRGDGTDSQGLGVHSGQTVVSHNNRASTGTAGDIYICVCVCVCVCVFRGIVSIRTDVQSRRWSLRCSTYLKFETDELCYCVAKTKRTLTWK